jgi:hypothetical protein
MSTKPESEQFWLPHVQVVHAKWLEESVKQLERYIQISEFL